MASSSSWKLKALIKKNLLIMKRNPCSTAFEILFPIALILLCYIIRQAFQLEKFYFKGEETDITTYIKIHQYYIISDILDLGVTTIEHRDTVINIYDKERMLIELLRYKNNLPFDYYKEILGRYRDIIQKLDIERIQEYAESFPRHKMISQALDMEVF